MEFLIAADDRTGALETAGALAHDGAGVVPMLTSLGELSGVGSRAAVVDIATRHSVADTAATRAVSVGSIDATRYAHKIDSTLRGNWASELVARHAATGHPVLVVPAYPGLGRTCVGGVVLDDGVPVHEGPAGHDVRAPITTSRPADLLKAAGALDVVGCHDLTDLVDWLEVPGGIAIADAATDNDLGAIANRWVGVDRVLLAGTSAAIGAAGARLFDSGERNERPSVHGSVLVVCGSAHPRALEQVGKAEEHGARVLRDGYELAIDAVADGEPVVLAPPLPAERMSVDAAATALSEMARAVSTITANHELGAIVVIGGDTADAVLGPQRLDVGGLVVDGTPWSLRPGRARPLIVTRAGGFGGPDALVDLVWGRLTR
ncbi:MAG TPA: four-carbon acid sugar kinase family protein [Ilumatobacteraceae bacterium]|nr:four-carbon acid sugar kinase family protein [Ilumatobacteraceae bacterium]